MNRSPRILGLLLAVALLAARPAPGDQTWKLTIHGNGKALREVPLSAVIENGPPPGLYTLERDGRRGASPAIVYESAGQRRIGLVLDGLDASATLTATLRPFQPGERSRSGVTLADHGTDVRVLLDGLPWTDYRTTTGPKPILYPLLGPGQQPVTRSYPMEQVEGEDHDHPHQRSFWFTHGNVNGVDFWSEQKGHGSIRETSRRLVRDGGQLGAIVTTDDWLAPDGKRLCRDDRTITFYATGPDRVLDFDVTVHATDGPVTFGDTKEGSFGLRVASTMDVKRKLGGKITNAEGLTDGDAWGKASPWVDYTGPVGGRTLGVAILNHPESFRFPTTWHVRDYGLFAANPFGYHDFGRSESGAHTIPDGGSMRLRYRVILHSGPIESAELPAAFEAYAHPPRVEIAPPGS